MPPGPDPSFTDSSYIYDSDGQRVTKTVSGDPSSAVHYVYDNEGRLIAEVDANGNTIREQVYVNGERVAFVSEPGTPNEATHFVHNDHLGTPKVVTASDKSVAWQAEYKPFGEVYGLDGSVENDFRFPGQYYDSETGYYYNYFRDYDPEIGRYLESDPIGLRGGLNRFAYAASQPLRMLDLFGLAYFEKRPLKRMPWFGPFSDNFLDDYTNTEISHEQLFFEDTKKNLGFFAEDVELGLPEGVRADTADQLPRYRPETRSREYNDCVMRKAVEEVHPCAYSLLGNPFTNTQQYNCQDWAEQVRDKYKELVNDPAIRKKCKVDCEDL